MSTTLAVIGSGNVGSAVAALAAKGGAQVQVLGRDQEKATALAAQVSGTAGAVGDAITGDIVVLDVPDATAAGRRGDVMAGTAMSMCTERLQLDAPCDEDLEDLHRLYSDARTWTHLPSGRFAELSTTAAALDRWLADWREHGLGAWVVREGGAVVGHGGCAVRQGAFWNLGYRFAPEVQGRGLATELAGAAVEVARATRPELPVVAYLLEHNRGSAAVAEKVGLTLRHCGPDAGNPDPSAVRLVLADRELDARELAATMQ